MKSISMRRLTTWRVAALLSGTVLGTTRPSLAQEAPAPEATSIREQMGFHLPRVTMKRDVAAQKFLELLRQFSGFDSKKPDDDAARSLMMSSFSRSSEDENLLALLVKLSKQVGKIEQTVTVQNEGDKVATVVIETKSQPIVLVQEGDSWGVDVAETFAKWNDLEGTAKTAAIAEARTEFSQERDVARRISCQSNLKQISLGMMQYAQDYGQEFPKAENWIDKILPYVKSEKLFTCPSVTEPEGYGYALNFNLSAKSLAAFESSSETVSIYETTILERNMYGVRDEPAFRHQDGANYAFADGHVKWLPKTQIPSFKLKP